LLRSSFSILVVAASTTACGQAPAAGSAAAAPAPASAATTAADEAAAHKAHEAYVTAINSNQLEAFLATVSDDIVFLPPNSPPLEGKTAVGEWVKGYMAAYKTEWVKTSREFVVRGDWAYEWYAYRSVDTPRAEGPAKGTPVVTDTGNGVNIYKRDASGVWHVARDVWATDKPRP
jgi:ketosteroid isomerase-like protein